MPVIIKRTILKNLLVFIAVLFLSFCFYGFIELERESYLIIEEPLPLYGSDCTLSLKVSSCGQKPLRKGTLVLITDRGRKIKVDLNTKGEGEVDYCMLKHNFPVPLMKIASRAGKRKKQGGTERRFQITEGLEYRQVTDSTYMYRSDTEQFYYGLDSRESIIKAKLSYKGYKLRGDHLSLRRYRNSFDMKPQLLKQFLKGDFRFEDNKLIFNLSICT